MKPSEQFALALRIIGVLGLIYVLRTVVRNPNPRLQILIIELLCVVVGVYLIRGATLVVNFAYPEEKKKVKETPAPLLK